MTTNNTIKTQIHEKLNEWGRGKIFFLDDLAEIDDHVSVRQFLCEMADDGTIFRIARGIYCYPLLSDSEFSPRRMLPSPEAVAQALASKEKVRIIPYGDQAACRLGLSGISLSNLRYLTDGSPRTINLSSGRKIRFDHTSEVKMFAFSNETMQMLSSAIRALGAERFEAEDMQRKVREILKGVPENDFRSDITLPPAWAADILVKLRYN